MVQPAHIRLGLLMAGGGVAVVGAFALPAQGQGQQVPPDPPGNNGTIKIDDVDFDDHPDNEPHVGCEFQVDFYGYDEGDLNADVTFEGIAPTGGGTLLTDEVFIGEDPAGGGTDLDASVTYDLSGALAGVTPHPVQGHHVELTIEAEGSIGAAVKHKVFWVEDCTPPTTTTSTSTTTTSTSTTSTTEPPTTTTTSTSTTTTEPPTTTTSTSTTAPTTTSTSTTAPTTTVPGSTTTTVPGTTTTVPATTTTTAPPAEAPVAPPATSVRARPTVTG